MEVNRATACKILYHLYYSQRYSDKCIHTLSYNLYILRIVWSVCWLRWSVRIRLSTWVIRSLFTIIAATKRHTPNQTNSKKSKYWAKHRNARGMRMNDSSSRWKVTSQTDRCIFLFHACPFLMLLAILPSFTHFVIICRYSMNKYVYMFSETVYTCGVCVVLVHSLVKYPTRNCLRFKRFVQWVLV